MITVINSLSEWKHLRNGSRFTNKTIGLVPTMGNLHAGHESLLKRSVAENDRTVLSIFVNPTQFDSAEDLQKYPKTLEQDIEIAKANNIDVVLAPNFQELYPDNYTYQLSETSLSKILCGKFRPGHFTGVLTVIFKFLNLVRPQKIYFGEKDYQQLLLVKGMVEALFFDVEVVGCPTLRDENLLALSSRNSRLTPEQYVKAAQFPQLLETRLSCEQVISLLIEQGFTVDYIEEHFGRRFGAVKLGNVRLIDNVEV